MSRIKSLLIKVISIFILYFNPKMMNKERLFRYVDNEIKSHLHEYLMTCKYKILENSMFNEFNESDRITSIRTIFTYNHVEFITYIVFENNTITYDLDIINANKIGNNIVGITEFYNRFKSIDTILISSYIQRYFENRKD